MPSTSKYTGVHLDKKNTKWVSAIHLNGKPLYLGVFDNEKEASEYYEAAALCIKEGRLGDIKRKGRSKKISTSKGVSFIKRTNKWRAYWGYEGKIKHLGVFKTEHEALVFLEEFKAKNK